MEEEEASDVTNNNNKFVEVQGVTLGESKTESGSCDSLLEIVNYLDSEDYRNGVTESESVCDVSGGNVDLPDVPVLMNNGGEFANCVRRTPSVRSDVSDHIISQFLDKSVDDVGLAVVFFLFVVFVRRWWKRLSKCRHVYYRRSGLEVN